MKKAFLIAMISIFTIVSCNKKTNDVSTTNSETVETDSTMMENDSSTINNSSTETMETETMYACPMHAEVQGKLNDKCPKCGMKLTETVAVK